MDDRQILRQIDELIQTEHSLRSRLATGQLTTEDEHARLRAAEEELDQCWDLLRQRRALRDAGADPGSATPRAASDVEGYLQ